ncbi:hypothetical protein B0A48_12557 [Cryoendolithus antarcticus]|uniref:Peptidase M12A domain-containing protein n=1 Tax=Cryoendolithus antarcticus TaxID=1507870 RepID=A0A1V8SRK9_9PEZI|nr:hypothetical protein B0A48_12557 [Cryoendolithus antarcticus]
MATSSKDEWPNVLYYSPIGREKRFELTAGLKGEKFQRWARLVDISAFAHELGHVFGLMHDHQRKGAYIEIAGKDAPLHINLKYIRGYAEARKKVADSDAPEFQGLDPLARMSKVIADGNLVEVEGLDSPSHDLGVIDGGDFDLNSIMLYNGDAGAEKSDPPQHQIVERANGDWVYQCGVKDLTQCRGPSPGDVSRVGMLYPKASATSPSTIPSATSSGSYRPMRVIIDSITVTIRPTPTTVPSGPKAEDAADFEEFRGALRELQISSDYLLRDKKT